MWRFSVYAIQKKSYCKWVIIEYVSGVNLREIVNVIRGVTLIIPISVYYYVELRNAITSCSCVQFLLTKGQEVV